MRTTRNEAFVTMTEMLEGSETSTMTKRMPRAKIFSAKEWKSEL